MKNTKVLVAYGTRYGSARITAMEIAAHLKENGCDVTVTNLRKEKVPTLPGEYDLVIAGSSIAMFSWLPSVKIFLRKCRRVSVPTAVFINSGMAIEDEAKARVRFFDRVINRIGLEPVLTLVTGPVLDFRPGEGLPEGLKNRIRGTIKAMAKEAYRSDGLMDLRDKKGFNAFLEYLSKNLEL